MITIGVVNQKGGVGKTTTVMNMSAILARHLEVLVVDADPQLSSTDWVQAIGGADDVPFSFTADTDPANLRRLQQLQRFDVVIVDTPGSLEQEDRLNAISGSIDFAVVPVEPDYLALKATRDTIAKILLPKNIPTWVLLNKTSKSSDAETQSARRYFEQSNIPVFNSETRKLRAVGRLPALRELITDCEGRKRDNDDKAYSDWASLTQEILSLWSKRIDLTDKIKDDAHATR